MSPESENTAPNLINRFIASDQQSDSSDEEFEERPLKAERF